MKYQVFSNSYILQAKSRNVSKINALLSIYPAIWGESVLVRVSKSKVYLKAFPKCLCTYHKCKVLNPQGWLSVTKDCSPTILSYVNRTNVKSTPTSLGWKKKKQRHNLTLGLRMNLDFVNQRAKVTLIGIFTVVMVKGQLLDFISWYLTNYKFVASYCPQKLHWNWLLHWKYNEGA